MLFLLNNIARNFTTTKWNNTTGYGAEADDVWSVSEELIEQVREDGVELPILDVGIAHGEKARGGSF